MELLDWDQLLDWQEFYDVDPWGDERADLRSTALAVTVLSGFAGGNRMPEPTYPYFHADESGAVDLIGTADALEKHLLRMLELARGSSPLAMEPGSQPRLGCDSSIAGNVTDQASGM